MMSDSGFCSLKPAILTSKPLLALHPFSTLPIFEYRVRTERATKKPAPLLPVALWIKVAVMIERR